MGSLRNGAHWPDDSDDDSGDDADEGEGEGVYDGGEEGDGWTHLFTNPFTHQFSGALIAAEDLRIEFPWLGSAPGDVHGGHAEHPLEHPAQLTYPPFPGEGNPPDRPLRLMALPPPPGTLQPWDPSSVWYAMTLGGRDLGRMAIERMKRARQGVANPADVPNPANPRVVHFPVTSAEHAASVLASRNGRHMFSDRKAVVTLPPGGPGAGLLLRDMERTMATVVRAATTPYAGYGTNGYAPYGSYATARINVLQFVLRTPRLVYEGGRTATAVGLGFQRVPQMTTQPHLLGIIWPSGKLLMLPPRLSQHVDEDRFHRLLLMPGGWEHILEESLLGRLIVAVGFLVWWRWDELTGLALGVDPTLAVKAGLASAGHVWSAEMPRNIGFALRRSWHGAWRKQDGDYYSGLVKLLSILMLPHELLDAQTVDYLHLDHLPRPGEPLQRLPTGVPRGSHQSVNTPLPVSRVFRPSERRALLREAASLHGMSEHAMWEDYVSALADRNLVPRCLVASRLDGDWQIRSEEQYAAFSHKLVTSVPDLWHWRADLAQAWRVHPEELVLWLGRPEPLMRRG